MQGLMWYGVVTQNCETGFFVLHHSTGDICLNALDSSLSDSIMS